LGSHSDVISHLFITPFSVLYQFFTILMSEMMQNDLAGTNILFG